VAGVVGDLPLIVVMPDDGPDGGYSDWYGLRVGESGEPPAWETYHTRELIPYVDATFPTVASRGGRFVAGLSSGGGLSAALALLARDRGGPTIAFQLLIYPVTDHNFDTPSYVENAEGFMLTREAMRFYWRLYLGTEAKADDYRASPLRARDVSNLPPALVITAEFDPLRDEGRAYADRLREAGNRVVYREYSGMVHGFMTSAGVLDAGKQAIREASAALSEAFGAVRV
jgi:acetyl esterase